MSVSVAQIVNLADARALEQTREVQEIDLIINKAQARALERGVAYRGMLMPEEAWTLAQEHPRAKLIDVRSSEELTLIGSVPGAIEVQWKLYPEWRLNPRFLAEVKSSVSPTDIVLLLCRSGIRSREAAEFLTREGFDYCFNILEGFEGDKNAANQRIVAGWKARGLPWSH